MWLNGLCSVVIILGVLIMGDTRKFHCPLSDMAYKKQTAYAHSISVSIKRAETTEQLQTVVYKLAKKWQAI